MNNNYDGSIVIGTELSNKGFKAGSKELQSAIQSLRGQVSKIGDGLKNAVSFKDSIKSTKEYENAVAEFAKTCASFDEAKTLAEAAQIVEDLRNQLDAFANTQYHILRSGLRCQKQSVNYRKRWSIRGNPQAAQ